MTILRYTMPPRRDRRDNDEQALPERIVLDEESFAAFSAEVENPGPPNAALIALFKKQK